MARVHDTYLYESSVKDMIPMQMPEKDKTAMKSVLIKQWIKDQLLFEEAKKYLSKKELDKSKELEDYYKSLVVVAYTNNLVSGMVDSIVSEEEIKSYYVQNSRNFELKQNIAKLLYIKVPKKIKPTADVKKAMLKRDAGSLKFLRKYARQNAANQMLDTSRWFYFDALSKEIPLIQNYDPVPFLTHNKYLELKDAKYSYLINLIDKRVKDDISPLPFVHEEIRQILINQKKTKWLRIKENEIYKKNEEANGVEIY